MRRLIIWTAILFVVLGGVLTAVSYQVRQSRPKQLMIVRRDDQTLPASYLFQDPETGQTYPVRPAQIRRFLRDGQLQMDWQDDLYEHQDVYGEGGIPIPKSIGIVDILAGHHLQNARLSLASPSPDWNWIIYRENTGDIFALNLDDDQSRNLSASTGVISTSVHFSIVFAPDGESILIAGQDRNNTPDSYGIYRLRLDGNNPSNLKPLVQAEWYTVPIIWLEGTDWILVEHDQWLWRMSPDGSIFEPILPVPNPFTWSHIQQYVNWLPQQKLLIISLSDWPTAYTKRGPAVAALKLRGDHFEFKWQLRGWSVLQTAHDKQSVYIQRSEKRGVIFGRVHLINSWLIPVVEQVALLPPTWTIQLSQDEQHLMCAKVSTNYRMREILLLDLRTQRWQRYPPLWDGYLYISKTSLSPDGAWFVFWWSGHDRTMVTLHKGTATYDIEREPVGWVTLD
ncbi:MAG: hypothetical protein BroJett018_27040 [Chloroflexota bacterium]|nr:MAG: hypothetical protein BroJett018_27040 [Chloroflexota bacterium]